ncbi:MAG: MerR family transcriptional regulator [Bdellovibrionales bacterium]|nr:MerR family transcriptional regulator [Bdellovibrionales bacterium]
MFDIEKASELIGVPSSTLRNWESRYGVIKPKRSNGGHRKYNANQVYQLIQLVKLQSQGHKISDLFQLLKESNPLPQIQRPNLTDDIAVKREALYQSLINLNQSTAHQQLELLHSFSPLNYLLDHVYAWLFYRIGEDWHEGALSVAKEHFATSFLRARLYKMLTTPFVHNQVKPVFIATPDIHEGGGLMLSCYLKAKDVDVMYLGPLLPQNEIPSLLKDEIPNVLCLSFVNSKPDWSFLVEASNSGVEICLGGAGLQNSDVPKDLPKNIHVLTMSGEDASTYIQILNAK